MATLLLQAAGSFLGSTFGPVGAVIGRAAGALAGNAIDRALFAPRREIEGARLSGGRPVVAEEGTGIARVYGTARLSGTIIWATRFEEVQNRERQGGKGGGGTTVTTYGYFANFAVGLCEGPIAGVRRIWADGRELDMDGLDIRIHTGTQDQAPDPLIEAKQGAGNAPAYRGLAYAVFDHFPLEAFGNRIPQLQFEVMRPVGDVENELKAICLIPGATEHGLSPTLVTATPRKGETLALNRHVVHATTDWTAALDELTALCPNLEHVALVVAWYGNDLRAGHCVVRPGVTTRDLAGESVPWLVSGATRADGHLVSAIGDRAAYGGTPSDASVIAAIRDLKERGLKVTLYPFVLMDVPTGNGLPDPYGAGEQAAYPWRGRITCHPAAGQPGATDATASAAAQVAAFCGSATPGGFSIAGEIVTATGADWGYRRFVLHCAQLCAVAGGVDAFLIGSELRGLTRIRDGANGFPFVNKLRALAADVRTILGGSSRLTYGADWSEYFGYQPADGSGNVWFNLDPLWADANIDAVGIDNYLPLSDWRDGDELGANPDGLTAPADRAGLAQAIEAGEQYDWYYASDGDRVNRLRSPIADGAYGKPWVFRPKDVAGWWGNAHHKRIGGVESPSPTAWLPASKPVWFTELGCPAIDRGANQPNVFVDPKSSENAFPHFSNGARDDTVQCAYLGAHFDHWAAHNPVSPVYGKPMLETDRIYAWAFDARPFPAFPLARDVWGDGDNWLRGHWLNGRLGAASTGDLARAILSDHGIADVAVDGLDGGVQGLVIAEPSSARAALEALVGSHGVLVSEQGATLRLQSAARVQPVTIARGDLVDEEDEPVLKSTLAQESELPAEIVLHYRDCMRDYQAASALSRRREAGGRRQWTVDSPFVMDEAAALAMANRMLDAAWGSRESVSFSLAPDKVTLTPGAVFRFEDGAPDDLHVVTRIEAGATLRLEATALTRRVTGGEQAGLPPAVGVSATGGAFAGPPWFRLLDLPLLPGESEPDCFRAALWAKPWTAQALHVAHGDDGFALRATVPARATAGILATALPSGVAGVFDEAAAFEVSLFSGGLESVSQSRLLAGANTLVIATANGGHEVLQFRDAVEIAPDRWRLSGLLRGQLGTEDAMNAGASVGADVVLLDASVVAAGLRDDEAGLALDWRAGPAGYPFTDDRFRTITATGGLRAFTPLSPVHLAAIRQENGDIATSWIRRTRTGGDNWMADDAPLGEAFERYRLRLRDNVGGLVREVETATPGWVYPATQVTADFASPPSQLDLEIVQLNDRVGEGVPARRTIPVS